MGQSIPLMAASAGALALAVAAAIVAWAATSRRWRALLRAADGRSLESLLLEQQRQLAGVQAELAAVREGETAVAARLQRCVRSPAVVRFNAFADTGSDLSFAVAFLDGEGNGAVVSGLYGREESRVYAKPVAGGSSPYLLSEEEKEAIRQAWIR
jgi:hypothetical protein